MLQQTQVNTVLPYYRKFLELFPGLERLAAADLQTVLKAWEGMGYYARARNLHQAAKTLVKEHGGNIPADPAGFRRLPGVGDYIASAVLSIAFNQGHAVVDGNVKRVLSRLLTIGAPVNKSVSYKVYKNAAQELLDPQMPGIFNQALMELGAVICKPKLPECGRCPIQSNCLAFRQQNVDAYPKRVKTKPTPEYHLAVGIVHKRDRVLITRRKAEGLLGGLWEFPGGKIQKNETAEAACIREIKEEVNLSVQITAFLTRVKHAYTHFRIVMDVFRCKYISGTVKLNGAVDFRWIRPKDIDRFPFPKANHKFIPLLE
jgi:A/G-specific adenine glycosylase